MKADCILCDHYVVSKLRSEFVFVALKEVRCFALTRKFLHKEVFPKYPSIAAEIKQDCQVRYRRNI